MDFTKFYHQIKDNLAIITAFFSGVVAIWSLMRSIIRFQVNDVYQMQQIKKHTDALVNINGKMESLDKKMIIHDAIATNTSTTVDKIDKRLEKMEERQLDIYKGLGHDK